MLLELFFWSKKQFSYLTTIHGLINFWSHKIVFGVANQLWDRFGKTMWMITQGNVNPFSKIAHGTPKKTSHLSDPRYDTSATTRIIDCYVSLPGSARLAPGRNFRKNKKTLYRKKLLYRKVLEMQKQRSVEVVKPINEWANGGWDATDMTWKNPCTTEWMNQWAK